MNCPVCDSFDSLKVKESVKRTANTDVRNLTCSQCGAEFVSSTKISHLRYGGDLIRVENAKEIIERLQKEYIEYVQRKITGIHSSEGQ